MRSAGKKETKIKNIDLKKITEEDVGKMDFKVLVEYALKYGKAKNEIQETKESVFENVAERLRNYDYNELSDDDLAYFLDTRDELGDKIKKDRTILSKVKNSIKSLSKQKTKNGKPSLEYFYLKASMTKEVSDWTFSDCVFYCRKMKKEPPRIRFLDWSRYKTVEKRFNLLLDDLEDEANKIKIAASNEDGSYSNSYKDIIDFLNRSGALTLNASFKENEKNVPLETLKTELISIKKSLEDNVKEFVMNNVSGYKTKKPLDFKKVSEGAPSDAMLKKIEKILSNFIEKQVNSIDEIIKQELEKKIQDTENKNKELENKNKNLEEQVQAGKREIQETKKEIQETKEQSKATNRENRELERQILETKTQNEVNEREIEALIKQAQVIRTKKGKNTDELKGSINKLLSGNGSNLDELINLFESKDVIYVDSFTQSKTEEYIDRYKKFLSQTFKRTKIKNLIELFLKPSPYRNKLADELYKRKRLSIAEIIKQKITSVRRQKKYNYASEKLLEGFLDCYKKISSAVDSVSKDLSIFLVQESESLTKSICEALMADKDLSISEKSGVGLLTWGKALSSIKKIGDEGELPDVTKVYESYRTAVINQIGTGFPETKESFICYLENAQNPDIFLEAKDTEQFKQYIQNLKSMPLKDSLFLDRHETAQNLLLTREQQKVLDSRIKALFNAAEIIDVENMDIATRYSYLQNNDFLNNDKFKNIVNQIQKEFNIKYKQDCSIENLSEYMDALAQFTDPRTEPAERWRNTVYREINKFLDIYVWGNNVIDQLRAAGTIDAVKGKAKNCIALLEQIVEQYSNNYSDYVKYLADKTRLVIATLGCWFPPSDPVAKKARTYYRLTWQEIFESRLWLSGSRLTLQQFGQRIGVTENKKLEIAAGLLDQGYEVKRFLASGSEGAYFLCKKDGKEIAVKGFYSGKTYSVFAEKASQMELRDMAKENPDIEKYIALSHENDGSFENEVAIEDMEKSISKQNKLIRDENIDEALETAYQTINGIYNLQKKGYVHNDIKPENIIKIKNIRAAGDEDADKEVYKINDLSMRTIEECAEGSWFTFTPKYMAPDAQVDTRDPLKQRIEQVKKRDVYSLGQTLLEFTFKNTRIDIRTILGLRGLEAVHQFCQNQIYERWFRGVTNRRQFESFIMLLGWMTCPNYRRRPSIEEVKKSIEKIIRLNKQ